MFSKACEYGIRALTVIAKTSEDGKKVGIKEVCKLSNTPESFTAKILQNLVKTGIIKSQKGPTGGFYISRTHSDITLKEIVIAIDGNEIFVGCGLGLEMCDSKNPCPMHNEFEKVRSSLTLMCQNSNLQTLTDQLSLESFKR